MLTQHRAEVDSSVHTILYQTITVLAAACQAQHNLSQQTERGAWTGVLMQSAIHDFAFG